MFRINKLYALGLIIIILLGGAFNYSAPHAINMALKSDAENIGLSIAQLMGRRIPDLGLLNKDDSLFRDLDYSLKVERVQHLAQDVLATDKIHQVDFINSDCMCAISLGSYKSNKSQQKELVSDAANGHKRAAFDGAKRNTFKMYKENLANHIFFDMKKHKPMTSGSHRKYQLPLDHGLVDQLIKGRSDATFVRDIAHPYQPAQFGEVYHMVRANNQVAFVIRILVDLTKPAAAYNKLADNLWLAGLGLLGFGLFYPLFCKIVSQSETATKKVESVKSIGWFELFTIASIAIIVLTLSLGNPLNNIEAIISVDKLKHTLAYTALGFVVLYGRRTTMHTAIAVIGLIAFGAMLELAQPLFGRSADQLDFMANVLGVAIAWCALFIVKNFDHKELVQDQAAPQA
ncbi:MAG: VanZ family protein [Hyphomicrobiales bacterium]